MATASTIFALSTAPGRAGVAVIRVSGPAAREALKRMAPPLPAVRNAAFRRIVHPNTGELIDRAIVLFFEGPSSETGEDITEFQVHGGRAVIAATLEALGTVPGCRVAEPGEFARRAFANGKLDLTQVEGLADLIDAETEAQRRQALGQSGGALSALYEAWRSRLIEIAALTEAAIDFSDEGDVAASSLELARARAKPLLHDIRRHLADGHCGEILRQGFRVALLGAPNAGKSSLLNALARREAAIVSEEEGTTRDVIEVRLDLGGYPVIVSDTAGIREAAGAIEREGIRRSMSAARAADLVLWLSDSGLDFPPDPVSRETQAACLWLVRTKIDLVDTSRRRTTEVHTLGAALDPNPGKLDRGFEGEQDFAISAKSGDGLDVLERAIAAEAARRLGDRNNEAAPALTQARHREGLEAAAAGLNAFLEGDPVAPELCAEDVRRAAHSLGRITGRVDVEDVLGAIFSRFCIGK